MIDALAYLRERFEDVRTEIPAEPYARPEWTALCPLCPPEATARVRFDADMRLSNCPDGHEAADILAALETAHREPGEDDGTQSLGVADFFATCDQQIEWLLEPYVFKGGFTLVQGAPKSGKTWLVAWIAAACAARGRKVLFVEEEGAKEVLRDRLKPFVPDPDSANATLRVLFRKRVRLDNSSSVAALIAEVKATQSELVILDPFIALHGKREKESDEMASVLGAIREMISATGCSVVLVHHTRKGESWSKTSTVEASSEDARGSGALVGEVDTVIAVKGVPHGKRVDGQVRIVVENPDTRVGAPFARRLLSIDLVTGNIAEIADAAQTEPLEEMLRRLLPAVPEEPQSISRNHLREALRAKKLVLLDAVRLGLDRGLLTELRLGRISKPASGSRNQLGTTQEPGTGKVLLVPPGGSIGTTGNQGNHHF